jgi:perosamine synthetase
MQHPIPIFRLQFDEDFKHRYHKGCEKIFSEAYLTNHSYVRAFEEKFAQFTGSKYCLTASNGTSALEIILRALNVHDKEVILPTNTFIATAIAVQNAGGRLKLLDSEPAHMGLDLRRLQENITEQTGAVIVVHIGGMISPQIEEIRSLCQKFNVPLVEDCAHAHGSQLNGRTAGRFGIAGAYSFHLTKTITMGEGGAVITDDYELFEKCRSIRQFGMDPQNSISHIRGGSNFKLTEFQALTGLLDLERAPQRIQRRQTIARIYQTRLKKSSWQPLLAPTNSFCGYYKQVVLAPVPRSVVEEHLKQKEIALTGGVYYIPLHRQPVLKSLSFQNSFEVSESFSRTHICPPCYPELTDDEAHKICDTLLSLAP